MYEKESVCVQTVRFIDDDTAVALHVRVVHRLSIHTYIQTYTILLITHSKSSQLMHNPDLRSMPSVINLSTVVLGLEQSSKRMV